MKTPSRRKLVVIFAIVITMLTIVATAYHFTRYAGEPLLKILVRTQGTLIFGGHAEAYSVYPSGAIRRLPVFLPNDVDAYRIDNDGDYEEYIIDSNTGRRLNVIENAEIYNTVAMIIDLSQQSRNIQDSAVSQVFILTGRYFFIVFDKAAWGFSPAIYEYVPTEKQITKITTIRGKNIEHIELFQ